jgi:PAS domain S-box-containing protein
MEYKQISASMLEQNETAMTATDRTGEIVDLNEKAADMFQSDKSDLLGASAYDLLCDSDVDDVKRLNKLFDGDVHTWNLKFQRDDGSVAEMTARCKKVKCENCGCCVDSDCLISEIQEVNVLEDNDSPASKQVGEESFDDLTARELQEIAQNIRVDAPDGKIPLNAVMFDLMVDHNEIEQVKKGALSLHEACDERLAEEQETNPDSPEVDVIREISESAYGLYLRIQRGDAELQGDRDGEYSGYWNS